MLNVLDKTEKGPLTEVDSFDKEYIYHTIKDLIDKYEIGWDQEVYVPDDDKLAERLFEAGMELALKTGVLCLDSSRRMVWSRDEMDWAINSTPAIVFLGADQDRCAISKRIYDSLITVAGGAIGISLPARAITETNRQTLRSSL